MGEQLDENTLVFRASASSDNLNLGEFAKLTVYIYIYITLLKEIGFYKLPNRLHSAYI